jgi:OOP family OmpA-OmpF porin
VRNELIKKYGIDANRLSARGHGSSKPIADNATPQGRQKNRRIEAVIEATVTR